MKIEQLKKELEINNGDIADFFELTPMAYANSSAKKRYEQSICRFYAFVKSKAGGKTKKTDLTDTVG